MNKTKPVLVIDNYDSFTFNLVHLLEECDQEVVVWRNDKFALKDLASFDKILLSPGPGLPHEAGLLLEVLQSYSKNKSILGVCLGLQAMAEYFGGKLVNLKKPLHGMATRIDVVDPGERLFEGVPSYFMAARYHSWAVDPTCVPAEMKVTAVDEAGIIMAMAHREYDVRGVQFHPESILSEFGKEIILNWLKE